MSLFSLLSVGSKILRGAKSVYDKVKGKKPKFPGGATLAGIGGGLAAGGAALVKRGLPAIKRNLPAIGGVAAGGLAGFGAGGGFGDGKKRRRMNPANGKALTRALRRVESFQKIQKRIEKAMRRACPPARRRASPSRCN